MRSVLNLFFLVFIVFAQAQDLQGELESEVNNTIYSPVVNETDEDDKAAFQRAAEELSIPYRAFHDIEETENGYYIISGTFSKSKNLNSQIKKLKKNGFNAGYFQNPQNQLYYLYLNHYTSWEDALNDCSTQFNNRYNDEVWVLKIINSNSYTESASESLSELTSLSEVDTKTPELALGTESVFETESIPVEEVSYEMLSSSKENDPAVKSKLIKRADEYFDKMWYAEAAKIYEQVLSKGEKAYTYDVLKKAGD
ncbi:MAG: SPOR domain-containing protein, partial [Maribacter sp.]|nr:SPOR domain-containing protein [Maribacter sp.]